MNVTTQPLGLGVDFDAIKSAIAWEQRSVTVYGKVHAQPRLTKWYGDAAYTYSNLVWPPAAMPELVAAIKARVETLTGERFNSVLCNLYRDGSDGVGWHADDEPIFGGDPVVASVSFGASRVFKVRPNAGGPAIDFLLGHGQLLVMGRGVQRGFQHSIPKTARAVGARVNLTFRATV